MSLPYDADCDVPDAEYVVPAEKAATEPNADAATFCPVFVNCTWVGESE